MIHEINIGDKVFIITLNGEFQGKVVDRHRHKENDTLWYIKIETGFHDGKRTSFINMEHVICFWKIEY